ncbi:MAG: hypothetical protein KDB60_16935, partial [Propionibacteriaceae bacterium]|nr:hypothetical protein [Propionibacteriaceae bacterium]
SATASAVITPALFGGLWDAVAGRPSSPQPSVTDSATPRAVELARKSNRSGSISLEVPRGWATTSNSIHNPFGERTPGDAFAAGVDPAGAPSVAVSRIWVAASIDGLERMKAIDPDPEVAAREQLDQVDWQTEGCQLAGITPFPGDALRGSMRKWVGCNGLDDQTFWEAWILTADQRAAVLIQFDIRAFDLDEATALLVLESIVIDPSRLSG